MRLCFVLRCFFSSFLFVFLFFLCVICSGPYKQWRTITGEEAQSSHECVNLSANSDQEVTYGPNSFPSPSGGGGSVWSAMPFTTNTIDSRLLIRGWACVGAGGGWGGGVLLCLCLSIPPHSHTSQQNNKWKHRTRPLSYQLITGLV